MALLRLAIGAARRALRRIYVQREMRHLWACLENQHVTRGTRVVRR